MAGFAGPPWYSPVSMGNGLTYEAPGGHWEEGETLLETAERELYEETGALRFDIMEISGYSVMDGDEESFGMLYYADILELGSLPQSEIAEVVLFERFPENWTYPKIQPALINKVMEMIKQDRKQDDGY